MLLSFPEYKPGTVQIVVTEDESDVILIKLSKVVKSLNDLIYENNIHLLPFDFKIDLSSHNVKSIKVTVIFTSTEQFDKEGWILKDQSTLQSLLHGMHLGEIKSSLITGGKQSHISISKSWDLKCPISVGVIASTEPSHPLFSIILESEEEVIVKEIVVNIMNGIVCGFQQVISSFNKKEIILLKPGVKHHWSFGISFLDNSTKLIVEFEKGKRESQHVQETNPAVLNIQIHLQIKENSKISFCSHWVSFLDFYSLYNSLQPLKSLETKHGKNFFKKDLTNKEPNPSLDNKCQIFFTGNLYRIILAPNCIYPRQIFSIQVYVVNTSAKERNFLLKIPDQQLCDSKTKSIQNQNLFSNDSIVCLEDSILIQLLPGKSSFINLHFVALKPCTSWIKKFQLYDSDQDAWIDLVNLLKITTI